LTRVYYPAPPINTLFPHPTITVTVQNGFFSYGTGRPNRIWHATTHTLLHHQMARRSRIDNGVAVNGRFSDRGNVVVVLVTPP
jgi:hypothetical protein